MSVADLRWRAHMRHERKTLLMALLGLLTATEFLEGLMFVFAAGYTVRGIGTNAHGLAQIQAAYAIGSMLMIVLQQWLSQRWGYRRYLCVSLVLFMLGTLACAASQGLWSLSAGRLLQGFGGGAFFTSSRILVNTSFKPAERPRAVKYFMLAIFAGSAVAPGWAALLLYIGNWRWVFLGGLPLAVLSLWGCWRLLPEGERLRHDESYPGTPLILFAVAVVGLQVVLAQVHDGFLITRGACWGAWVQRWCCWRALSGSNTTTQGLCCGCASLTVPSTGPGWGCIFCTTFSATSAVSYSRSWPSGAWVWRCPRWGCSTAPRASSAWSLATST